MGLLSFLFGRRADGPGKVHRVLGGMPGELSDQEYEQFCGGLLEQAGWSVRLTRQQGAVGPEARFEGDEGLDILAVKNGRLAVFHCERFLDRAGDQAILRLAAARTFYHAEFAAVVTSGFCAWSSMDRASASQVKLLHHDELAVLSTDDL